MRIVVIGSGLLGLVTAYFLNKAGAEVCVVDRQDSAGRETSFANGGMLHASQVSPWNSPGILWAALRMLGREDSALLIRSRALPRMLRWATAFVRQSNRELFAANIERNARLAQYSLKVMQEIRAIESLQYDYARRGTLSIFRTQRALDAAAEFSTQFAAGGMPFELLDRAGVLGVEPALGGIANEIVGGSYYPEDESGDAFKFCQGIYQACERNGVEFLFNTEVNSLVREGRGVAFADIGSRRLTADQFVLAAGSFTPLLAKTVGLRVPVQPVKGYSITAPMGAWQHPPIVPVIDEDMHAAVCPLGNRLRVAGTAEFAGYNSALTKSRVDNLFKLLFSVYPEYEPHQDVAMTERWTGLRPMTTTGVGLMGQTPLSNLYLNTGHGHLGWTMAAGAGKAVAAEVMQTERDFSLESYHLSAK